MLKFYPIEEGKNFNIQEYYKILSKDFPDFLGDYIAAPSLQRLKGIGLLCGTDFTKLYKNRFYYSRLDHSIAVALIIWHFTHNKEQCLSGLFHDISTPIFSHVCDFRKGDALTQTITEDATEDFIKNDETLCNLLKKDNIPLASVSDYHIYPIADNERPQLSADRLEYMFPSGCALMGCWQMEEIENTYNDIGIMENEFGVAELGFNNLDIALNYTEKFCQIGHILQLNENKLTLELLGKITNMAIQLDIIHEEDCHKISEKTAFELFKNYGQKNPDGDFAKYLRTYLSMENIKHSFFPLKNHFNVNLKVKQRYINPLVKIFKENRHQILRITDASPKAKKLINDFLNYKDFPYGSAKFL